MHLIFIFTQVRKKLVLFYLDFLLFEKSKIFCNLKFNSYRQDFVSGSYIE